MRRLLRCWSGRRQMADCWGETLRCRAAGRGTMSAPWRISGRWITSSASISLPVRWRRRWLRAAVEQRFAETVATLGPVHACFANAGVSGSADVKSFVDMSSGREARGHPCAGGCHRCRARLRNRESQGSRAVSRPERAAQH